MEKEKKISFFIIFILAAVLFAASGQMGCQKGKSEFDSQALMMGFVEEAPPEELVPSKTYPIYVDIENKGGADILSGAHFYLSGFSPETIKNTNPQVQNAFLLVKKTTLQEGGKERLVFATAAQPAELQADFDIPMQVDACYKYSSSMQTSICVGETGTGAICTIEEEKIKTGDNSPSPLQITSLTENVVGNKLFVIAIIENKGIGSVYLPNVNCDLLIKDDINEKLKKNSIQIAIATEAGFKCSLKTIESPHGAIEATTGILDLSGNLGKLTCYKILTDEPTHTVPFSVTSSYVYEQSITKSFKILPP